MNQLKNLTEPELKDIMSTLAHAIELMCHEMNLERPLFCLVLFNDPEIAQYIGNCRREDMIQAMRETADRLERRQDVQRDGPAGQSGGRN